MANYTWGTIHPSVFADAGRLLRWTGATRRPHGAVRYRCPVTGSLVLVTDSAALKRLARKRARLRCAGCGEMHMLACEATGPAVIVEPSRPA